jgi:hypothetical protein
MYQNQSSSREGEIIVFLSSPLGREKKEKLVPGKS